MVSLGKSTDPICLAHIFKNMHIHIRINININIHICSPFSPPLPSSPSVSVLSLSSSLSGPSPSPPLMNTVLSATPALQFCGSFISSSTASLLLSTSFFKSFWLLTLWMIDGLWEIFFLEQHFSSLDKSSCTSSRLSFATRSNIMSTACSSVPSVRYWLS